MFFHNVLGRKQLAAAAIVLAAMALEVAVAAPTLQNGNFSAGLAGWTVEYGDLTDGGGFARFRESANSLSSTLSQTFYLPAGSTFLSFEFWMTSQPDDTGGGFAWPDAFSASLLDPDTFDPLIANLGSTDFFYIDTDGNVDTVATMLGNMVKLDVSSVAGRNVFLSFDLWASVNGLATRVDLDNVAVSVIPAPSALLLAGLGIGLIGKLRRKIAG